MPITGGCLCGAVRYEVDARPMDERVRAYGDRDLPLRYRSKALLMSRRARLGRVEPDRAPLA